MAQAPTFMVFFDWDSSRLSPASLNVITQAVTAFRSAGNARITATGHTDTTGPESYNMALSLRRANAVKNELVRQGVPAPAITVIGKGESQLLVPTGDNVREPQNRRVEIVISGQMAAAPVSNDLTYCRALSAQYRRLLGGTQADAIAGDALA
ncbi:MAG TPA: OmpA family protein, partial [Reyranella sp.]